MWSENITKFFTKVDYTLLIILLKLKKACTVYFLFHGWKQDRVYKDLYIVCLWLLRNYNIVLLNNLEQAIYFLQFSSKIYSKVYCDKLFFCLKEKS